MQTIKEIYDGISFFTKQPVPVKGCYTVEITFLEPIIEQKQASLSHRDDSVGKK